MSHDLDEAKLVRFILVVPVRLGFHNRPLDCFESGQGTLLDSYFLVCLELFLPARGDPDNPEVGKGLQVFLLGSI